MDCYDEILNIYHEKDRINKSIKYLIELINKKSKRLTELSHVWSSSKFLRNKEKILSNGKTFERV